MNTNGTKVSFKFQAGFGTCREYTEGTGIVTGYGFSTMTGQENTYTIRTEDGRDMHVMSYNVRGVK